MADSAVEEVADAALEERALMSTSDKALVYLKELSNRCKELLLKITSIPSLASEVDIDGLAASFNIWAANIGVFREGQHSLDSRLKGAPHMSGLIRRLLAKLERDLGILITKQPLPESVGSEITSQEGGASACDSDNSLDRSTTYQMQSPSGDDEDSPSLDLRPNLWTSIQNNILNLHHIASVVHLTGNQHRHKRLERFINLEHNKKVYAHFYGYARVKVAHLFPKMRTSLQERTAESIARRQLRFRYLKKYQIKTSTARAPAMAPDQVNDSEVDGNTALRESLADDTLTAQQDVPRSTVQQSSPPSVISSKTTANELNQGRSLPQPPESVSSFKLSTSKFPPMPRIAPGSATFVCPYCSAAFTAKDLRNEDEWLSHLMHDFEPFFCVVDGCSSPFAVADTYTGWLTHMRDKHTPTTLECRHCKSIGTSEEIYNSLEELEIHLDKSHPNETKGRLRQTSIQYSIVRNQHALEECPFCAGYPSEIEASYSDRNCDEALDALEQHVGDHLASVALTLDTAEIAYHDDKIGILASAAEKDIITGRNNEEAGDVYDAECLNPECECKHVSPHADAHLPPKPQETMMPSAQTAQKWAVLIGVDFYIKGQARYGITFPNLGGCVEDVNRVKEYLQDSEGIPESNIFQLTATTPDNDTPGPKEDKSKWPTYENMIQAIKIVTEKAKANDVVYIHYSGHGIRTATIFDDLKGEHAHDKGLVPTNIHCEKGRYVRDVEIAYLLQNMVKKGLIVTVVLDCCHSGGASRGNHGGDPTRYRSIDMIDENKLPSDKSDLPYDKLREVARKSSPTKHGSRKATVEDHWLLRSSGYTFLAACQQHQTAMETQFGDRTQGLLTYCLLEVLRETHTPMNHHQLWTLVALKVAKRSAQHVVLGGESNRMFLSSQSSKIFNAATVIEVSTVPQGSTTAIINAGQAHGVQARMKLDVWPPSCTTFYQSERLGYLTVTSATEFFAEIEFTKTSELRQPLQVSCLALPCSTVSQKRVRISQQEDSSDIGVTENSLTSLQTAWAEVGNSFARLIDGEEDEEDFQIRIDNGTYVISGKGGASLQHAVPPLPINGDNVPRKLVHWLTHLAKYHNVLELADHRNSASGLPRISVSGSPEPYPHPEDLAPRKADCPRPKRRQYPDSRPAEERLFILEVENKSEFVVYITVLDLDSTWGIEQMHPQVNDTCDSLDPGQSVFIPMNIHPPPQGSKDSDVLDIFLVFATREPTSFAWLELPELVEVDGSGRRGTRGESEVDDVNAIFGMTSQNPLQAMQATWTLHEPATRKSEPWTLTPPSWTVEHLVLTEAKVHS